MKRCPRCGLLKPDANFIKARKDHTSKEHAAQRERCASCRSHTEHMIMTTRPSLVSHALEVERWPVTSARETFREELRAFRERGAPVVNRPYLYNARGFKARPNRRHDNA